MKNLEITTSKLQNWLDKNKPVFILDVRSTDERNEWFIPESSHLDVYDALKEGDESTLTHMDLPEDRPIVTVCTRGRVSLKAAKIFQRRGLKAYSLHGGMKAWNYAWNTAELQLSGPEVHIIQVRRAAKGCLSYVIGSGKEAMVVDASLEPDVYIGIARRHGRKITRVMDTHIHADYISRTRELAEKSEAEYVLIDTAETGFSFKPLKDGQVLSLGDSQIKILHTPGHTPESTSFLINDIALLTGDTLFTDGVGRPDLKADRDEAVKKAGQLYESLQKILSLPGRTQVLPAHISHPVSFDNTMIQSSLSELKSELELLRLPKPQFIEATLKRLPEPPENYLTIAGLNKKGSYEGYLPADLEIGANRCAVS